MCEYLLEMRNISKFFPGVKALNKVCFKVKKGQIHALVGENGAGKSTLMKILGGAIKEDEGEIFLNGKQVEIKDSKDAKRNGISLIFQEFNLVSSLSVAENIFLGELSGGKWVNWKKINSDAQKLIDEFGFKIKPKSLIKDLSVAEKQMVEITKALAYNGKIIIMDEPTSTLADNEVKILFKIIRDLKEHGITIVYISHRMEEIFNISDAITVLRDGETIDTFATKETDEHELIEKMVGRPFNMEFPPKTCSYGDKILEIKNLSKKNVLRNITFDLHRGEILGIAGLVGSGRTELSHALFGVDKIDSGEIIINGQKVKIKSTAGGVKNSIGLVPEDRKEQGLVLDSSVMKNISICNLNKVSRGSIINKKAESKVANDYIGNLNIKTPSVNQNMINLSGGNQQKVVFAKWHFLNADIIILDEPTRGIDVGAKYEIYLQICNMAKEGKAIIMISSELNEVIGLSDRILVMHQGEVKAILDCKIDDISAANIMRIGISEKNEGECS